MHEYSRARVELLQLEGFALTTFILQGITGGLCLALGGTLLFVFKRFGSPRARVYAELAIANAAYCFIGLLFFVQMSDQWKAVIWSASLTVFLFAAERYLLAMGQTLGLEKNPILRVCHRMLAVASLLLLVNTIYMVGTGDLGGFIAIEGEHHFALHRATQLRVDLGPTLKGVASLFSLSLLASGIVLLKSTKDRILLLGVSLTIVELMAESAAVIGSWSELYAFSYLMNLVELLRMSSLELRRIERDQGMLRERRRQQRREMQHRLQELDRVTEVGSLAAGIGHDLRAGLAAASAAAQLAESRSFAQGAQSALPGVAKKLADCASMVRSFGVLGRRTGPSEQPLADLFQTAEALLDTKLKALHVERQFTIPSDAFTWMERNAGIQIAINALSYLVECIEKGEEDKGRLLSIITSKIEGRCVTDVALTASPQRLTGEDAELHAQTSNSTVLSGNLSLDVGREILREKGGRLELLSTHELQTLRLTWPIHRETIDS